MFPSSVGPMAQAASAIAQDKLSLAKVNAQLGPDEQLKIVKDPQAQFAAVTKGEYVDFRKNFGQFERDIVDESLTDTSLVDNAPMQAMSSLNTAAGMNRRNLERYGGQLNRAQSQQLTKNLQTGGSLGILDAMNQGALAQRDINTNRFYNLINIGQGVQRDAMGLMGTAADLKSKRDSAARAASEQAKAQRTQNIISLGAIIAFSDARLKENIVKVGELANGLGLYTWEWNDIAYEVANSEEIALGDTTGVIAQELEAIHPELVINTKSGYKAVNYSGLRYKL